MKILRLKLYSYTVLKIEDEEKITNYLRLMDNGGREALKKMYSEDPELRKLGVNLKFFDNIKSSAILSLIVALFCSGRAAATIKLSSPLIDSGAILKYAARKALVYGGVMFSFSVLADAALWLGGMAGLKKQNQIRETIGSDVYDKEIDIIKVSLDEMSREEFADKWYK